MSSEISSVSFAYFAPENSLRKGLFVALETDRKTFAAAVFGNDGLDWKEHGKRLLDLRFKGEIGDEELITRSEAESWSKEVGLSLEKAHAQLSSSFEKNFGKAPNIVDPTPSLEDRINATRKGKTSA